MRDFHWSIQANVTNKFTPFSLEKDIVKASEAYDH